MNTQAQLVTKFGNPMTGDKKKFENDWMILVDLQKYDLIIPALPTKIYLNKLVKAPFLSVLDGLIAADLHTEIKTFDGCYNVRFQRGSKTKLSRHSFGLAFDFNAAWNPLVKVTTPPGREELYRRHVKFSQKYLQVWRDNGFACGADWQSVLDGQHTEYVLINL